MQKNQFKTNWTWMAAAGITAALSVGVLVAGAADGTDGDLPGIGARQDTDRQVFTAALAPANGSSVSGTVRIVVQGGTVGFSVDAAGLSPNMMHEQHVHSGTQCPTLVADTNGDGYIDPIEGAPFAGEPIYPLQLNRSGLDSSGRGNNLRYPVASQSGVVSYIQSGPIAPLLAALNQAGVPGTAASPEASPSLSPTPEASPFETPSPEASPFESPSPTATPLESPSPEVSPSPTGTATPISLGQLAALEGRVIEIHGIDTPLPSTVRGQDGRPANETLPVACGVITSVIE